MRLGDLLIPLVGLIGALLWLGGIAIAVYLGIKLAARTPKTYVKCPFCAEMIKPEATVCKHCGRDVFETL